MGKHQWWHTGNNVITYKTWDKTLQPKHSCHARSWLHHLGWQEAKESQLPQPHSITVLSACWCVQSQSVIYADTDPKIICIPYERYPWAIHIILNLAIILWEWSENFDRWWKSASPPSQQDGSHPHLQPPDFSEGAMKVVLRTTVASTSGNLDYDHQEGCCGVSGPTLNLWMLAHLQVQPRGQVDARIRTPWGSPTQQSGAIALWVRCKKLKSGW